MCPTFNQVLQFTPKAEEKKVNSLKRKFQVLEAGSDVRLIVGDFKFSSSVCSVQSGQCVCLETWRKALVLGVCSKVVNTALSPSMGFLRLSWLTTPSHLRHFYTNLDE